MGFPNYNLVVPSNARIDDTCRTCINEFIGRCDIELTDEDVNQLIANVNMGLCRPLGGQAITGCSETGYVRCGVVISSPEPRNALTLDGKIRDKAFEKTLNKEILKEGK